MTPETTKLVAEEAERYVREYHKHSPLDRLYYDDLQEIRSFISGAEYLDSIKGDGWNKIEDGLPEVDSAVEVITEYITSESGKKETRSDRFIGYMDEYGDLLIAPNGEDYGWQFNDCVVMWRPLPPIPSPDKTKNDIK